MRVLLYFGIYLRVIQIEFIQSYTYFGRRIPGKHYHLRTIILF